jgi:O-antigen ligase
MVVAFAGYAAWRYTQADIEYHARIELLQVFLYALIFFAILDNLARQESIQTILFALIAFAMLNSFYAVFQYLTDSQSVLWYAKPAGYHGRGSGTYICPNHLAGFLEMILPIALAYTVLARFKPLTKVFTGYAALAILAGLAATVSRGGYVAAAAGLFLFFFVLLWNRDFRIPALALLLVLLVAGSFFGFRSFKSQKRFAELEDGNVRLLYWKPAVEIWKANPVWGVGAGHYDWRFRQWRPQKLQGRPMYVHNDYLHSLAEYGAVGTGIIGASLLVLGWGVIRSWKFVRRSNEIASKPSTRSAVVLGCSAGLVAILVHSAGDFNMHIPANALVAVTLMAVLATHWRYATERYWLNPGIAGRLVLTACLAGLAGYLALQLAKIGPQSVLLERYFKPMTFEQRIALLEKAHAFDPSNTAVTLEMGELLRKKAWEGEEGYQELLKRAIPWLEKGVRSNPWNPYTHMNLGMCYHWLKQPEKATEHFDRSLALDPRGYYILAMYGWHKLQLGDLEAAHEHLKRSFSFFWDDNPIARNYLPIVERMLAEKQAPK